MGTLAPPFAGWQSPERVARARYPAYSIMCPRHPNGRNLGELRDANSLVDTNGGHGRVVIDDSSGSQLNPAALNGLRRYFCPRARPDARRAATAPPPTMMITVVNAQRRSVSRSLSDACASSCA
jgi:hypothetical protein